MFTRLFTSRKIFVFLLAMGVFALLGACGGGGGGISYPDISYTGVDTEAVIDQTNAADFPFVALEGGSGSGDIFQNLPVGASIDPEFAEGIPDPENIKKAANIIGDLIKNQMSNSPQVSGVTESIVGNCAAGGGKATLSGNDTGSQITASMQMDNFCSYDSLSGITVKMHGLMNITILYYGDYIFTDFTMSIQYLKMTVSDGVTTVSEEFSGTIKITDIDPGPPIFSVSVNFKYEGKIFKIVNLAIVEDNSTNPASIWISGKLYHPVHGYVVITTTDPFVYNSTMEQFCNGALEIKGVEDITDYVAIIEYTDAVPANTPCMTYDICITIENPPGNAISKTCSYTNDWGLPPSTGWVSVTLPAP